MLKLKKVQILGFKSFCDRTEIALAGEGIAAIVGPNGCGKSNISDAITWVLGEQSAKSLRGIKMEDVIFAGTRDRKPTGMAEVSLTLVDPEVYDSASTHPDEDISSVVSIDRNGDWDETALRQQRAEETEEAVAEAQPGTLIEGEAQPEASAGGHSEANPDTNVVLKIRRRKFGRAPIRAGELTITRRLFRTGDSEYLLNGKICRLRDIQDIFMGTGLGGESYAIIGQERIGQLLSSKPLDRRAIIEEAAGITRFKTKKRLAELRLESARQNLSRVDDIFEEVTKQMGTLKRQAAKAQRYQEIQAELKTRLRVVLASRLTQLDTDHAATSAQIASLTAQIDTHAAAIDTMDAAHTEGVRHGYTLDSQIRESNTAANQSAVELERIAARTAANADRVLELTARLSQGGDDLAQARAQLATLSGELETHRAFVENANAESAASRDHAHRQQAEAQAAVRAVGAAEQAAEQNRRATMQLMQRAAQSRNEETQASAALSGLLGEAERLTRESATAHAELETLGLQRGQVKLSFDDVTARLKSLETSIASLRDQLATARNDEAASKRKGDQLRGDRATLTGRRNSLEALIREHSYSTDTVRNLFRATKKQDPGTQPLGTLADLLEVGSEHEALIDEYLRDELNTVIVPSWTAADDNIRLLQKEVAGRATFLITHQENSGAPSSSQFHRDRVGSEAEAGDKASGAPSSSEFHRDRVGSEAPPISIEGTTPLRSTITLKPGISLDSIPKLRDGYLTSDPHTARTLAQQHPEAFFLTPTGETFHHLTVTGGRPSAQGPLALKRELHDVQAKVDATEAELMQTDQTTANLHHHIAQLNKDLDGYSTERRDLERESANSGAALRQIESEVARLDRRLQDWQLALARNGDARKQKEDLIAHRQAEAADFESKRTAAEHTLADLQQQLEALRRQREELQHAASAAAAALAGLEERRRNAAANLDQTTRLLNTQQARIAQLDTQLAAALSEKLRREEETASLATQYTVLAETRGTADATAARLTGEAATLRSEMAALDTRLRTFRHDTEVLRDQRATLSTKAARLASDLEHLDQTCANDLGLPAADLLADQTIPRIEGDLLAHEETESRTLKTKLEAMGPVNMMALEEYTETATRHLFLETQRRDLLDSIENTRASIKEIDDVSRIKFDEAFKIINGNFSIAFTKLFGGGQASMSLTDAENSGESGIDILASPPGKKLQNILLLSGGEKALTALSLLVGIFQFQPAPFCVLDEVDAPLDETNVGRFAKLIAEMSADTQFVVITHSKRTMQQADVIYGVTMQEPGVSKIVSVNLNRQAQGTRRAVA